MTESARKGMEGSGMSVQQLEQTVFSQGPVVLFRWRTGEDWPVDWVTENAAEIFGHGAEDFLDGTIQYIETIHPDDRARVAREVTDHIAHGPDRFQHLDYRVVRKDGGIRWVQDFTVLQRNGKGRVTSLAGYVVDITGRKRAEMEIRETHEGLERKIAERTAELTREILERELMEKALRRRDAIQQVINQTTMQLFSVSDWRQIAGDVLGAIGEVARADRVHLFRNGTDADGKFSQLLFEWTATGVDAVMGNPWLDRIDLESRDYSRWTRSLSSGKPIYAAIHDMTAAERRAAETTDVSSMLMVPIFVNTEWWGTISFIASRTERVWNDAETQSLGLVAGALGTAVRRGRDEEALRRSEERLRGAIESLQEGFAYFDAEDRLVVCNDAYRGLNPLADRAIAEGWTYEDLLRANVARGALVEARGNEEAFLMQRLAWHRDPGRPIIRGFGVGRIGLIKEARTPDGGTALTLFDITELEEANRALDRAETEAEELKGLLQDAIESAADAFALYDAEGRLVLANEAYKTLFGHTREVLTPGTTFESILRHRAELGLIPDLGDDPEGWFRERLDHFFNFTGPVEREFPDGSWWQVNEQRTRRGGIAQIATNITQIKAREAALRESEARFRNLFYHTAVGTMIVGIDGRYRAANEALCRMLGYPEAELQRMSVLDVTHPQDRKRARQVMADCRSGRLTSWIEEKRYLRKDGQTVWAIVSVSMIRDAGGRPLYSVGHVQDITERKRAETATRALQDELAHVSRVSTMGEMATGFAHELNQPLTAIVNYAQGTLRRHRAGTAATDDYVKVLELVAEQALRAGDVIRGIRKFVRKEESETGNVDINTAIEETVGLLRTEAQQRDVTIDLDLSDGLPPVPGNAVQLQQVILNLGRNAFEAMADTDPEGRRLTIATAAGADGEVSIFVEDTGPGIAEPDRKRLFDPFYTTKPEGMGMGLSICRSIVNAHGGGISAGSADGGGASFRVDLKTGVADPVIVTSRNPAPEA